jgi:hypothetical protein
VPTRKTSLLRRELGKESENAKSQYVGRRYSVVLSGQERQIPAPLARAGHQGGQRTISKVAAMKFATARPYADPDLEQSPRAVYPQQYRQHGRWVSIVAAYHTSRYMRRAPRLIHFAPQSSEQSRNLVDGGQMLADARFRNRFNHSLEIARNLHQFGFRHLNHLSRLENAVKSCRLASGLIRPVLLFRYCLFRSLVA